MLFCVADRALPDIRRVSKGICGHDRRQGKMVLCIREAAKNLPSRRFH